MPDSVENDLDRTAAARDWASQLVNEAKRLVYKFEFLHTSDQVAFREALSRLEDLVAKLKMQTIGSAPSSEIDQAKGPSQGETFADSGDVESLVLQVIGVYPEGASVTDIFAGVVDMGIEMSREALTVRLHRMMRAGKIVRKSQGHYVLSPNVIGLRVISG